MVDCSLRVQLGTKFRDTFAAAEGKGLGWLVGGLTRRESSVVVEVVVEVEDYY